MNWFKSPAGSVTVEASEVELTTTYTRSEAIHLIASRLADKVVESREKEFMEFAATIPTDLIVKAAIAEVVTRLARGGK